jgi:hypothetical protein
LVSCFCVTLIGAGGLAIFWLSPANVETSISPAASPTPVSRDENPAIPAPPDPVLPDPETTSEPPLDSSIPTEVARVMDEVEQQVVEIRGLESLGPVDRYLMTPEELREHVMNEFLSDYTEEDARDDAIELAAFGLVNKDYDLYTLYLDLYSEQISGFYDDELKAMYVIQGGDFLGPQKMTYAHEYVHALQDQHYDLRDGLNYNEDSCKDDSERCAAIQALVEGDASFTETQWYFTYSTEHDRREIMQYYSNSSSPVFDNAPPFMRESLIFPYLAGQEFVEYLYDRGGWDAVDAAYRNPPVSTSQIMHPESYPDKRPVVVDVPDLLPNLGDSWREVSRNVIGEYYTYLFLAHGYDQTSRLREVDARRAAEGWAGDTYVVYYNDATAQTILVLQTAWDSLSDADEFVQALTQFNTARFGRPSLTQTERVTWESAGEFHQVFSENDSTTWVMAPDGETANQIFSLLGSP